MKVAIYARYSSENQRDASIAVCEEFCDEFTREMNRLRMEHCAGLSAAERQFERLQNDIRRVIEAIKNGFAGPDVKAEWDALQEWKTTLQAKLDSADEPPPLRIQEWRSCTGRR